MEHLSPPVLAECLYSVWQELGGKPELCPPAAWLEVAEQLQRKMLVTIGVAIQAPDDRWYQKRVSLNDIKSLCLLMGLDPKTTPVREFAAGVASNLLRIEQTGLLDALGYNVPNTAPQPATLSDFDKDRITYILLGEGDNYSAQLLRLINKADKEQRDLLATIYPDHVSAYMVWEESEPNYSEVSPEVAREWAALNKARVAGNAGHVDVLATEPKPPFWGVPVLWEHGDYLRTRYKQEQLRSGYYPQAAQVYDAKLDAIDNVQSRRMALCALVPLQVFADGHTQPIEPPASYVRERCSFCDREGFLSPSQSVLVSGGGAYAICTACVPRLVGSPAQRRPDDQQPDAKAGDGNGGVDQTPALESFTPADGAGPAIGE